MGNRDSTSDVTAEPSGAGDVTIKILFIMRKQETMSCDCRGKLAGGALGTSNIRFYESWT